MRRQKATEATAKAERPASVRTPRWLREGLVFSPTGPEHRVTTLELLFDLVFVYAITSVTGLMAHDLTALGLFEGLVVSALIWFGWSAYAWLGNQARADAGPLRLSMLVAMAAFFVVALTIPEAFHDRPGGLSGPWVFVIAYAVVRFSHLAFYALAAGGDTALRRTIRRAFLSTLPAIVLLGVGVFADEHVRVALWTVAVVIDYLGIYLSGGSGWRLPAPGHFAERHQLVVLIAIGESIVSVGVGLGGAPITTTLLVGAVLGVAISAALWWTYFDIVALVAERVLAGKKGDDRTRLARDTFTYLHLPVVAGIVYLALGIKIVIGQAAASADGHDVVFSGEAILALYGGAALYLLAMSSIRWRDIGSPNVPRIVAGTVLAIEGVGAGIAGVTGLGNLVLVAGTLVVLVAFETVHYKAARASIRSAD